MPKFDITSASSFYTADGLEVLACKHPDGEHIRYVDEDGNLYALDRAFGVLIPLVEPENTAASFLAGAASTGTVTVYEGLANEEIAVQPDRLAERETQEEPPAAA